MTPATIFRRAAASILIVGVSVPAWADPAGPAGSPAAQTTHHTRHATRHRHRGALAMAPGAPATQHLPASPPAVGAAPVPNEAVAAPIPDRAPDPTVAPSVFALHYPPQGDGYVTGSSPQAMDDRNAARATGVQMTVPLQQQGQH